MKTFQKFALGAAMLIGATVATAAPAAAQSFGFSLGGPGYSLNYNSGYPGYYGGYGYYGRPSYYGYPPTYYSYPSYYAYPRPYYGRPAYGRPYYGRPTRGYRR